MDDGTGDRTRGRVFFVTVGGRMFIRSTGRNIRYAFLKTKVVS